MSSKIKCVVCGRNYTNGAACHSLFIDSSLLFYCSECLKEELEPYEFLLEWARNFQNFPEECPINFLTILNKNLKYYNKTFIDFLKDLDKSI